MFVGGEGLQRGAGALTAWRRSEHRGAAGPGTGGGDEGQDDGGGQDDGTGRGRKSSNNGVAARCGCEPPRRIRVAASVLPGPCCAACATASSPREPEGGPRARLTPTTENA